MNCSKPGYQRVNKAAWKRYKIRAETNAAMLGHTDLNLGRLVAVLDELGIRDNTFIMVVSDKGKFPPPVEKVMR